jgi:farnesyl diphosphate synthase
VGQANYGRKDSTSVRAIKDLYKQLELEAKFKEYEAASYEALSRQIEEQPSLPKAVFTSLLKKIYKRSK